MKRLLIAAGVAIGLLLSFMPQAASKEPPVRIGIIDTHKILRESKAAKSAQALFMKDLEAKRATYQAKEKEVRLLEEELKALDPKVNINVRQQKADKLAQESKELKRFAADIEEELKKKDVELTRKLLNEIANVVKTFAKSERYSVILEKTAVVTSDDALDITDRIIKLYDAGNK